MSAGRPPARDLTPLFDPRSLAILGASATPSKWGYWLARSALKGLTRRSVFLVNRGGKDILGQRTYASLADVPQPVDLVVISIGAAGFEQAVDEALAAGARAIVAITAGLGETGREGRTIERAVTDKVRAAGALLVGPNCMGVADTVSKLDLASSEFAPGSIGLISQSGNLGIELALIATEAGVGFSRFVSVGNQADLECDRDHRVLHRSRAHTRDRCLRRGLSRRTRPGTGGAARPCGRQAGDPADRRFLKGWGASSAVAHRRHGERICGGRRGLPRQRNAARELASRDDRAGAGPADATPAARPPHRNRR